MFRVPHFKLKPSSSMSLAAVIAFGLLTGGCTVTRDMTEMHDSTKHMDEVTTKMAQTTGKMDDKTGTMIERMEEMAAKTDTMITSMANLYVDGRQATAAAIRRDSLESMEKSPSISQKFSYVAQYMDSFEFQAWKGFGGDSVEKREALYGDAAEQFFKEVRMYMPSTDNVSPLATDNKSRGFLAFSAALDEVNPNQLDLAKQKDVNVVSFQDIMMDALSKRAAVQMGDIPADNIPKYIRETLANEDVAVHLLQTQHNFISAVLLAKMAHIELDNLTNTDQIENAAKQVLHSVTTGELDLASNNVASLSFYIEYFKKILRDRQFLKQYGYGIKTHWFVRDGLTKLHLTCHVEKLTGAAPREKSNKIKLVQEINDLVKQINEIN